MLVNVAHLGWEGLIICVLVPVYPIVAVLQSVGDDIHLFPQRLGSLCYDTCDLLNLRQLHLKPLVHVIILWKRGHRRSEREIIGLTCRLVCAHLAHARKAMETNT